MNRGWIKGTIAAILMVVLLITGVGKEGMDAIALGIDRITDAVAATETKEEKAKIIGEDTSLREENVKHYIREDGTMEAVIYPFAVHYQEPGQEEWKDIDNTLVTTVNEDGQTVMTNKANSVKYEFPVQLSESGLIKMSKDGKSVGWSLKDANEAEIVQEKIETSAPSEEGMVDMSNISSKIIYKNVKPGIDLEYVIEPEGIKEYIVINKKMTLPELSFALKTEGVTLNSSEEKGNVFQDTKNNADEEIFTMKQLNMQDSEGKYTEAVDHSLTQTADGTVLTIQPDESWLKAKDTEYPVRIDPDIELTGSTYVQDTFYTTFQSGSFYTQGTMQIYSNTAGTSYCNPYIKFPTMPDIGINSKITDAAIELTPYSFTNTMIVNAYEITAAWDQTSSTQPTCNTSNIIDQVTATTVADEKVSIDVMKLIDKWMRGASYGIALRANTKDIFKDFYTTEATDENKRPILRITYECPSIQSNPNTITQDLGLAGTVYVDTFTGALNLYRGELSLDGTRMPVMTGMRYSTQQAQNGGHDSGKGWMMFGLEMLYYTGSGTSAIFIFDSWDGEKYFFTYDEEKSKENYKNTYTCDDWVGANVTYDTTGYRMLTTLDGIYKFGALPNPISYSNLSGTNAVTYNTALDNWITRITDAAGRIYNYTYDASHRITDVELLDTDDVTAIQKIHYTYNASNQMTQTSKLTLSGGNWVTDYTVNYEYDANGMLTKVKDQDGYYVTYGYSTYSSASKLAPRVTSISEYAADNTLGDTLTLTYGTYKTTLTDRQGKVVNCLFDAEGNISQYTNSYGDLLQADSSNTVRRNDLLGAFTPVISTANMLKRIQLINGDGYNSYNFEQIAGSGIKWFDQTTQEFQLYNYTNNSEMIVRQRISAGGWMNGYNRDTIYTFYTKIFNSESSGGHIAIRATGSGKTELFAQSEIISETNTWKEVKVSLTVPAGYSYIDFEFHNSITTTSSAAHFKDFYAVPSQTLNKFNLVQNAEFNTKFDPSLSNNEVYGWQTSDITPNVRYLVPDNSARSLHDVYALQKYGNYAQGSDEAKSSVWQTVSISGDAGDTFSLSGWARALSAVAPKDAFGTDGPTKFSIGYRFIPSDPNVNAQAIQETDYNYLYTDWQYAETTFTAPYVYRAIEVHLFYNNQPSYALFDGIQLYKLAAAEDESDYSSTDWMPIDEGTSSNAVSSEDTENDDSISAEGVINHSEKDVYGNVTKQSVSNGRESIDTTYTYQYDNNYLDTVKDALGNTTEYTYDQSTGTLTAVEDPRGNVLTYVYSANDPLKRLQSISESYDLASFGTQETTQAVTSTVTYGYTYPYLTSIDSEGADYQFVYDKFGALTNIQVNNGGTYVNLVTNIYDALSIGGRLTRTNYANGQYIEYFYDSSERLIKIRYNGSESQSVLYAYDEYGTLLSTTDNLAKLQETSVFDEYGVQTGTVQTGISGRTFSRTVTNEDDTVTETINGDAFSTHYNIDRDGRYNGGVIGTTLNEVRYDDLGRVKGSGFSTNYDDGTDGNESLLFWTSYSYTDYLQYKTTDQVSSMYIHNADNTYTKTLTLEYDANGNITKDGNITYQYDALNQLTRVNDPDGNTTIKYYYDEAGNIQERVEYIYVSGEIPVVLVPTDVVEYTYNVNNLDQLVSYDGQSIVYDASGNPTAYLGKTMTWAQGRSLSTITQGTDSYSYTYDASGLRQSKTVNGTTTWYSWNGSNITWQQTGDEIIYYYYDTNGTPIAFSYENGSSTLNGTYYYVKNLQGDIIAICDGQGDIVTEYKYDAWGKILTTTGTLASTLGLINSLRYRGYYYDNETSFYYLQSRYYDAGVGRFINADNAYMLVFAQGQMLGANMYAYCGNNAVNDSDPSGYYYLNDSRVMNILRVFITITANISITYIAFCIKAAAAYLSTLFASIPVVGTVLAIIGMAYIAAQAWNIAEAFFTALTRRKGLDITVGWWWGWIPYADFKGRVK